MPGTGMLGKLFFKNFLEDFGRRWRKEHAGGKAASIVLPPPHLDPCRSRG
jgi:hypothetical protein